MFWLLLFPALLAAAQPCPPDARPRTDSSFWNGWGVDAVNSRFQPAAMAGALNAATVPKLKLKWAFGVPNAQTMAAQPAVAGGVVYVGSQDGTIYALDAHTGCEYWTFKADAAVRTAITVAAIQSGRYALLFGDAKAQVYALDTTSRKLRWKTKVDEHPWARLTGPPKLWEGRLYVPVSSNEEVPAGNPKYECCTFRGSVVALDEETGKILWKTHTIAASPQPTIKTPEGVQLHGPNGAAVWSSPTIDARRRLLYVATGNAYTPPAAATTDSILALDLGSGAVKWSRQLATADNWTFGCVKPKNATCPDNGGPDHDIGASPILWHDLLLVGQKSGVVHALDANAEGKVVWRAQVGKGSALGGVMWGMAADDKALYVPMSDQIGPAPGGLFALDPATGRQLWSTMPEPRAAQAAAATAIPGVVFSGDVNGRLRAYSAATGEVIWLTETAREFETVNGVKARGGSMSAAGVVIAERMVFVNSGYGVFGGRPGNVLLAFE